MKKSLLLTLRRCLSAVAFVLILVIILNSLADTLRGRDTPYFYTGGEDYDVLFLGSSHMVNAVSPMELWNEYGTVSCNLSENGQVLPVTYYVLMDALNRQKPKLVVLDIYKIIQDTLYDQKSYLHMSLDYMPLGTAKLRAVYDFLPAGERNEFLFDLILYHTRWKDPDGIEREERDPDFRGYVPLYTVEAHDGFEVLPADETSEPPDVAVEYLKKIVDLCRERDVDLLFVATPFTTPLPDDMDRQRRVNAAAGLAAQWGVPFLNMMHCLDELDFDLSSDLADTYHANVSGMKKITSYLGSYITAHYSIPDRRSDPHYASWPSAYSRYTQKLNSPAL